MRICFQPKVRKRMPIDSVNWLLLTEADGCGKPCFETCQMGAQGLGKLRGGRKRQARQLPHLPLHPRVPNERLGDNPHRIRARYRRWSRHSCHEAEAPLQEVKKEGSNAFRNGEYNVSASQIFELTQERKLG